MPIDIGVFPISTCLYSVYPSQKERQIAVDYIYCICKACSTVQVDLDKEFPLCGFMNTSIGYREPTFHHKVLAEKFQDLTNSHFHVVKASSKDNLFAKELSFQADSESCTRPSQAKLHLFTRFLEHVYSHSFLEQLIAQVAIGDYIYIEMLCFEDLASQGNCSFLWCERVTYPSRLIVERYLESKGIRVVYRKVFHCEEPFFVLFCYREKKSAITLTGLVCQGATMVSDCIHLLWNNVNDSVYDLESVSFYGVSHKALAVADMISMVGRNRDIYLYDSSENKYGTYWMDHLILPYRSDLLAKSKTHVISWQMPNPNSDCIYNELSSSFPDSSIIGLDGFFTKRSTDIS